MRYDDFEHASRTYLPINRKERFYTGTVLPALLFHRGLRNLFQFFRLIKGFPSEITQDTTGDSFLFYTEYNLRQSAGSRNVGRAIQADSNDTPDVLIFVLRPVQALVAVEAKVFSRASQSDLDRQMSRQRQVVLSPLREHFRLADTQIFHVALVPQQLKLTPTDYQVLNWETLLDERRFSVADNHFSNYLRFALDNYGKLVSALSGFPTTATDKWTGQQIEAAARRGEPVWIGLKGGETTLARDIEDGRWPAKLYFVNSVKPPRGRPGNWVSAERLFGLLG